jgi:glycosyltransferase 2 family protein
MVNELKRPWLRTLVGAAAAVVLLWLFFRGTDWRQVGVVVREADPTLLLLGLVFNLGCGVTRAWRWRLLLLPLDPAVSLSRTWRYYVIGLGVSTVVPGRAGDLVRPYLMARSRGVPFSGAIATIICEHVLDLFMVLSFFGIMFFVPDVLGAARDQADLAQVISILRAVGSSYLTLAVLMAALLLLLRWRAAPTLALLERLATPLPQAVAQRLLGLSRDFSLGISGQRGLPAFMGLAASTVAAWVFNALAMWSFLTAFELDAPLTHVAWLSAVTALGVALPTPGGTGTYHAAAILVVGSLWGMGATQGAAVAAFAIVSHLTFSLLVVSLAPWYILREGLTPSRMAAEALAADGRNQE